MHKNISTITSRRQQIEEEVLRARSILSAARKQALLTKELMNTVPEEAKAASPAHSTSEGDTTDLNSDENSSNASYSKSVVSRLKKQLESSIKRLKIAIEKKSDNLTDVELSEKVKALRPRKRSRSTDSPKVSLILLYTIGSISSPEPPRLFVSRLHCSVSL